tara:strand:+ start:556 stop:1374 length:819 start_codon:yes stop_codon:yes gene_type:complete
MSQPEELMELLFKQAAGQAGPEEQARIEAILAQDPGLNVEFEQWQEELPALRESIQLAAAGQVSDGTMPDAVRAQLLEKVRDQFGVNPSVSDVESDSVIPAPAQQELAWHWALIPATGLAAVFAIALNILDEPTAPQPNPPGTGQAKVEIPPVVPAPETHEPVIQLALLDVVGVTRGAADETRLHLKAGWQDLALEDFDSSASARQWLKDWPAGDGPAIKILYHHSSGELKVVGRLGDEEKTEIYTLTDRAELPGLILKAQATIESWLADQS